MDRIIETTPKTTPSLGEQGSALMSVLLLVVIGFISTAAYIQFQKFLSDENRIVAQKLEAVQWQHTFSRAFADAKICDQFNGLTLTQDPPTSPTAPPTFSGVLPAPAAIYKNGTTGATWAQQGRVLPASDMKLGVSRIRIANLKQAPYAPPAPAPSEYIGYIEIGLGPVDDPAEPVNMTRSIRPIRIKKRFKVTGSPPFLVVTGCTELPPELMRVDAFKIISPVAGSSPPQMQVLTGNSATNTMLDTKLSFAQCPTGTKVVGGGYEVLSATSSCTAAELANVALPLSNYPYFGNFGGVDEEGWAAWVLCQEARAFAYCMVEPPKPGSP